MRSSPALSRPLSAALALLVAGAAALATPARAQAPAAAPARAAPVRGLVERVGVYSNIEAGQGEDPHAYGYVCELYRQGDRLFGLLYVHQSMVGDTPRGRLQEIRYDPASGALSFRAKLTLGREITQETDLDGRPSRDLFEFEGRLQGKRLSGSLRHRDGYHPEREGERERVVLQRSRSEDLEQPVPASRAAWEAEPLFNGPQW